MLQNRAVAPDLGTAHDLAAIHHHVAAAGLGETHGRQLVALDPVLHGLPRHLRRDAQGAQARGDAGG